MISLLRRRLVTKALALAGVWLVGTASALAGAQADSNAPDSGMAVDRRFAAALRQISADRIRANIEKLVSFGTRSTISAQDPGAIQAGRRGFLQDECELWSLAAQSNDRGAWPA